MRKDRKKANLPSLNDLIEKFSQEDVIAVMEKEYQSAPAKLIPSSLIDDTPFIKEVVVPESTIDTFAAGLQEKGFYNPLVVRPKGDRYELILGRKRFLGAKKAGILSLPCAIVEVGDEEELLMLLADTRDQRDTNVVEMALICEALQRDFGYTQQTLAELSHQFAARFRLHPADPCGAFPPIAQPDHQHPPNPEAALLDQAVHLPR